MSILCLGQTAYDMTFSFSSAIVENQKQRVHSSSHCLGGPVGNASYLCGLWGAKTYTMARVGDDVFGKEIIKTLQSVHIDTSSMLIDQNTQTSMSAIVVNEQNGSRTILNIPLSENAVIDVQWPQKVDIILFDGHEFSLCMEALQRYPSATTILDGDRFKPHTIDLIRSVDYLICGEEYAKAFTHHECNDKTYQEMLQLNSQHVILTCGEKGCIYQNKKYPAFLTHSIDTTGAGDVFHGAFAYGLDQGWNLEKIIDIASKAASLSTEKIGGMLSIPTLQEVYSRYPK